MGICISPFPLIQMSLRKIQDECLVCLIALLPCVESGMVSITVVSSCSASNQPTLQSKSSDSTCVSTVLSHSRDIQTSSLVAMQHRMQASGISGTVARRTNSSKRSTTNNLYDYRWKSWVDWCFRRKVDPFKPSVIFFCDVLIFIHDTTLCPATVKGYRSAISTTLKQFSKVDFSNESILFEVVKSFALERPRQDPRLQSGI